MVMYVGHMVVSQQHPVVTTIRADHLNKHRNEGVGYASLIEVSHISGKTNCFTLYGYDIGKTKIIEQ